jgi:surface antigen
MKPVRRTWNAATRSVRLLLVAAALLAAPAIAILNGEPARAQAASSIPASLGYPWAHAPTVSAARYDWGYRRCPPSDAGCMRIVGMRDGFRYGESDPWGYYLRNCTSYVAWQLAREGVPARYFNFASYALGNANQWLADARSPRWSLPTGSAPQVGAVAVSVSVDHVMFVTGVGSNGSITVQEYNYSSAGNGDIQTSTPKALGISGYIYYEKLRAAPPGAGAG